MNDFNIVTDNSQVPSSKLITHQKILSIDHRDLDKLLQPLTGLKIDSSNILKQYH